LKGGVYNKSARVFGGNTNNRKFICSWQLFTDVCIWLQRRLFYLNVTDNSSYVENIKVPGSNAYMGNQLFGGALDKISLIFIGAFF
jgi:hypothetical protein